MKPDSSGLAVIFFANILDCPTLAVLNTSLTILNSTLTILNSTLTILNSPLTMKKPWIPGF